MTLKKRIITLVAFALLTLFALLLCFHFADNALGKLPDSTLVNYNLSIGKEPVSVSYFDRVAEKIKTKYLSFTSEGEPLTLKDTEVTPVYTTFSFFKLNGAKLTGNSFTEKDQQELKKKAIISDTLALKLYFNTDAVGKIIELDGEEYIVSGVYTDSQNLIDKFSKDGRERIYIPYTLAESPENLPLDTIIYDNHSSTAAIIEQMNLPQYHFTSLSEKAMVLECIKHVLFLLLYIGLASVLLYFWYRILKNLLSEIGENLKVNYFLKSLTSVPIKYLLLVLVGLGIPALLVFVFIKSDFSIYIVAKYIPYDNIFEVSHYVQELVNNAHLQNSLALTGNTYPADLYYSTFSTCLWLTVIFLIFYVSFLISLFNMFRDKAILK